MHYFDLHLASSSGECALAELHSMFVTVWRAAFSPMYGCGAKRSPFDGVSRTEKQLHATPPSGRARRGGAATAARVEKINRCNTLICIVDFERGKIGFYEFDSRLNRSFFRCAFAAASLGAVWLAAPPAPPSKLSTFAGKAFNSTGEQMNACGAA